MVTDDAKIIDLENAQAQTKKRKAQHYRIDDDIIAQALAEKWQDKAAYFHNDWHVYDGGVWSVRDLHELRRSIRQFLITWRRHGVKVTQAQVNALASMMEDECYLPDREITAHEETQNRYINLRNGMFNLETFTLEPHRPDLYFTHQLDFDYDPDADCPTFRKYLNDSLVDQDGKTDFQLVHLVYQALAYSMTARTDLKASFWLVGKPDAGKSTFVAFLRLLMGSLHSTIDLNQLGTNNFLLADAVGKRVVTFTEGGRNTILPDWLYKTIVGGSDALYANVKNKPAIRFVPRFKVWWGMNEMPRISDRSGATFNRLYLIPFNKSIPKHKRIPNLEYLLFKEAAGIFNDILPWYQRLCRAGEFETCDQSLRLRAEYQSDNDTEAQFYDECLEKSANGRIQVKHLMSAYREWCVDNGYTAKGRGNVSEDWKRLGLQKSEKINGVYYWYGATLKS